MLAANRTVADLPPCHPFDHAGSSGQHSAVDDRQVRPEAIDISAGAFAEAFTILKWKTDMHDTNGVVEIQRFEIVPQYSAFGVEHLRQRPTYFTDSDHEGLLFTSHCFSTFCARGWS